MTTYLGFSCSQHDPSMAVVNEGGEVVFAEANERALKCKRGWHAPPDAFGVIEPVLDQYLGDEAVSANLTWSRGAIASVGVLNRISRLSIKAIEIARREEQESLLWRGWTFRHALYRAPTSASQLLLNLELRLGERRGFRSRFQRNTWNHHLCHAATACYSSPFENAICVVVDGMGEGSSTAIFSYDDGKIKRLDSPRMANIASLGIFYSQLCFAAGFDPLAGEEWKLMGLAGYGKLDNTLYQSLRNALTVKGTQLAMSRSYEAAIEKVMPFRRRSAYENADLAFTAQKVFEDVLSELLNAVHERWNHDNLVLTGGCALNSSANGKVLATTPFKHLHVPMAPGDDGNSIGAALLAWQTDHAHQRVPHFTSPYLGTCAKPATLERLKSFGIVPDVVAKTDSELTSYVADALVKGAIVGWMQGRAEFGPRALGNRSILADPRPENIRDRLNASVKFREEFRPFAPSILHEHGKEYFEDYSESLYMERTLKWREGKAPAGVRHIDNTGRLQSVTQKGNPLLHQLLSTFHGKTGVPIFLNTSFNIMGRPIIHDVEDALGVYFTSGLDLLVLDNMVFKK
jgi:carbamoyltransferase